MQEWYRGNIYAKVRYGRNLNARLWYRGNMDGWVLQSGHIDVECDQWNINIGAWLMKYSLMDLIEENQVSVWCIEENIYNMWSMKCTGGYDTIKS